MIYFGLAVKSVLSLKGLYGLFYVWVVAITMSYWFKDLDIFVILVDSIAIHCFNREREKSFAETFIYFKTFWKNPASLQKIPFYKIFKKRNQTYFYYTGGL